MQDAAAGRQTRGLWQTSKWTRHYDWDWSVEPPLVGQEVYAAQQAETLPPRFYYSVARDFRADRSAGATFSVSANYVDDTELTGHMLTAFRVPTSFVDYLRQSPYGPGDVTRIFRLLRDRGLIVPADGEEPIDWRDVFAVGLSLYGAIQIPEEIVGVLELLATRPPKVFLEIGTAWGGSLFCWAQVADPQAHLISLDLPGSAEERGYTAHHVPHFKQFCHDGQRLSCILGDSSSPAVLDQVRRLVADRTVDVLFIDGDHTYEGLKRDFENYAPMVTPGGLIMLHDIVPAPGHHECIEVHMLWDEMKGHYESKEFVRDRTQVAFGIGVLHV